MSVAELREFEEVKGLIARAQQVGVLTYAGIATATAITRFSRARASASAARGRARPSPSASVPPGNRVLLRDLIDY